MIEILSPHGNRAFQRTAVQLRYISTSHGRYTLYGSYVFKFLNFPNRCHHLPLLTSQPPPSVFITTTTICHYYHHNNHHLSQLSSQPPPSVTIIITTTTIYHHHHHNHHHNYHHNHITNTICHFYHNPITSIRVCSPHLRSWYSLEYGFYPLFLRVLVVVICIQPSVGLYSVICSTGRL